MEKRTCKTEGCNAEVSEDDEFCPQCGTQNPLNAELSRPSALNRLVIIFLIVFFVGMGLFMVYVSNMS